MCSPQLLTPASAPCGNLGAACNFLAPSHKGLMLCVLWARLFSPLFLSQHPLRTCCPGLGCILCPWSLCQPAVHCCPAWGRAQGPPSFQGPWPEVTARAQVAMPLPCASGRHAPPEAPSTAPHSLKPASWLLGLQLFQPPAEPVGPWSCQDCPLIFCLSYSGSEQSPMDQET